MPVGCWCGRSRIFQRFATRGRAVADGANTPSVHFGPRELQANVLSVMDMVQTLRNRETTIHAFSDCISHAFCHHVSHTVAGAIRSETARYSHLKIATGRAGSLPSATMVE